MMSSSGRTFYVSSKSGRRENDGLSSAYPFDSLSCIDGAALIPGDIVLLECGSVFRGEALHISSSGTSENPICISSYGKGPLPRIETEGQGIWFQDYGTPLDSPAHVYSGNVSSSILLYDAEYITLEKLDISNHTSFTTEEYSAPHRMDRTGVSVIAKDRGTLHSIMLRELVIHDIDGNVYNKHMNNGGIYISSSKPDNEELTGISRFEKVHISRCTVYNVSRWGIAVGYTYRHADFATAELPADIFDISGNKDIVIEDCYTAFTGGDGITAMYSLAPVLRFNTVEYAAAEMNDRIYTTPENRMGKVAAGLWTWKCLDSDIHNNYVASTVLNQDGMAYDADSGDGALYHDNYSFFNEGGCIMFCLEEAVNSIFRNNISFDDLSGSFSPSQCPNGLIEDNNFTVRSNVPFIRTKMGGGSFTERNNIFTLYESGNYPEILKNN